MKNNFQSKAVPRGTRTIWRYLGALFLLFTFAIGNVWADTEIFSWTVSSALAKNTSEDATGGTTACTGANMGSKFTPTGGPDYYKFGTSTTLTFTLSSGKYAAGDVISVTFTNTSSGTKNVGAIIQETTPKTELITGVAKGDPEVQTYTVLASDGIAGENKFSVMRGGSDASNFAIRSVTVTRPAPSCSTEITTQPSDASLAIGGANPELSIVATNADSYAWKESSDGTSYDGSSTLSTSANYTPEVNDAVQTKYYYCEVTSDCDGTTVVKSDIVTVEVVASIVNVTGVSLDKTSQEFTLGATTTTTLTATVAPNDATNKAVSWESSAPTKVSVTDNGDGTAEIEALAEGTATITVTTQDGSFTATCDVTVNPDPCHKYFWFSKAADATTAGVTNNEGSFFTTSASGSNSASSSITIDEVEYAITNRTGNIGADDATIVSFTIPANKAGTFYTNMASSGNKGESSSRTLYLKKGGVTVVTATNAIYGDGAQHNATIENIPSGTYTLHANNNVKVGMFAVKACDATYHTITLDLDGGTGTTSVAAIDGVPAYKPADPTKEHADFVKWVVKSTEADYNWSANVTGDLTLKAVWSNWPTLTLAAGEGATGDPIANKYKAGTEITVPEKPEGFSKGTDVFTGWAYNQAVTVTDGKFTMPSTDLTLTAQWQAPSDFDVKFFQGYGDPDVQIGTTQSISTGNYATAPTPDPTRTGYAFLGWSYDATEAHIVNVTEYAITAATNFTAMWKAVWTVTFDGAGNVIVEDGEAVASPNSPVMAGKVFQGWYNGESKYDFSAAVTGALALTSKWAAADPNHYVYAYNDDFHFDGVVYKTPEGKVDNNDLTSNKAITTPYTLFSGAGGITSIVATGAIYDSKGTHVNAFLKLDTKESSYLTVTIASGYTAVMKVKMGSWNVGSAAPTVTFVDEDDTPVSYTGTMEGKAEDNNYAELTYNLSAGTYKMTTATKTLYFSNMDIEATALPTHTVTYKAGEGTGDDVEDADATNVADVPSTFSAPTGKVFNGWKDESDNDVAVGAIVEADMTLTAQWINHYAVTFNMNGHGDAPAEQDIKHGEKAAKPADPSEIGWIFGGWFTDNGTFEAPFDFETPITAATPLFAKWTAFDGCVELWPATSGETLIVGATVDLQTGSTGGSIKVANLGDEGSIAYNANGLSFSNGGKDSVRVTLNNELKNGSVIKLRIMANGATHSKGRGLNLYNAANAKKALLGWQADEEVATGDVDEFTYTVEEGDGFAGTNIFILQRQNSVFLQSIKVTNCGAAIVYHNLTSAVNIAGKGTVSLGATSVREGYTTTATYSDIDPLYEFVNWTVSGAGASIADASANPATITMGTEDAVVTLNLRLIPVKFTVEYYDGATLMGSEQVAVNENPTASEIVTAKRHYTFLGWSDTDGGDVVALNTITRTEAGTVKLYAKYEAVACPTSGTIFSMEFDETKKPGETVKVAKNGGSIDMAEYATISGGNAMIINNETDNKDAISEDGEFLLKATKEVMKIELNCVLQEGDIIRIPDNSAKLVISTSNAKTGTYQAFADKNTHEFAVTAAWAGVDDIYVLYDGSSLKFTKVYVIRPAKYDVSFNMMGHGSAIADLENVIEGSKIAAPSPAPTDADYSFAGWYKENTLENEWKFDVDVVETNTTLYAKWLDKSDATLKSLKYGETEIALEAGIYTYNVSLPAFTSAVPALTAETSNPNATKVIANAAAFDSEGNATSTVTVTPEVGADQVYYVNFAKGVEILLQDVTGSITWNFANAVTGTVNITGTPQVLANYGGVTNDNTFESDKLEASGEKFTAGNKANLRANYIHFHTTVPGMLTISYSNTGSSNPARYIYVNGAKYDEEGSANTTPKGADNKVFVPAGDVELVMKEGEDVSKNVQIYQMIFNATPDYTRDVTEGKYGTICLPTNGVMIGTTIYTLAFYGATSQKIFFDEVVTGRMEAGKPYLFLPEQGVTELKVFYTDSETKAAQTVNGFHGYIGDSEDPEDALPVPAGEGNYIVQNNTYREVQDGATAYILSHRAYITFSEITTTEPAKAPGARRIGLGKDAAQGLEDLQSGDQPMKVMIDGTLYIIRGEKVYNANGQVVK